MKVSAPHSNLKIAGHLLTFASAELLEEADLVFEISHQGRIRPQKPSSRTDTARGAAAKVREETPAPENSAPSAPQESGPPSVDMSKQVTEVKDMDRDRRHGDLKLYSYFFRTTHVFFFVLWLTVTAIASVMERMPRTLRHQSSVKSDSTLTHNRNLYENLAEYERRKRLVFCRLCSSELCRNHRDLCWRCSISETNCAQELR